MRSFDEVLVDGFERADKVRIQDRSLSSKVAADIRANRVARRLTAAALVLCVMAAQGARAQGDPAAAVSAPADAAMSAAPAAAVALRLADFRSAEASAEVRALANWVVHSADNQRLPFMVIDKVQARVFAFDATGLLRGATSALLGTAVGDHTVPGIGTRKLSEIRPHERTTPAGRFVAYLDRDIHNEEVLWVDYESALSLHRVVKGQPRERRAERLASPTPADNRITFGCINVSVSFYNTVVSPLFQRTQGIVYVLPETRPMQAVFNSYAVQEAAMSDSLMQPALLRLPAPVSALPTGGVSLAR